MSLLDLSTPAITEEDLAAVRRYAESIFACGAHSVHGPSHWDRVEKTALEIARETGADEITVRLFAILHDSCRVDDGADPGHGPRAANMLGSLVDILFAIDPDRLSLLEQAIRHHTDGLTTADPTIGACWDADRLDLPRVGTKPASRFMSTAAGLVLADRV